MSFNSNPLSFVSIQQFKDVADTDDSSALQRGLNALSGTGVALWIPDGYYILGTPTQIPSDVIIWGSAGARLVSTITPGGGVFNTPLIANFTPLVAPNTGTVHTNFVIGAASISVAMPSSPTVGHAISILHGFSRSTYDIKSVTSTGGGNYTIGLDRPVVFPFVVGDRVDELLSYPHDIRIYGNGMQMSGTGDRIIEILSSHNCEIRDVHYDAISGVTIGVAISFDIGGWENRMIDVTANLGGSAGADGVSLESQERSYGLRCRGSNGNGGILVVDGWGVTLEDCSAQQCTPVGGISILSNTGSLGAFNTSVLQNNVLSCANGISISDRCFETCVDSSAFIACGIGLNITSGATSTKVKNIDVSRSTTKCISAAAEVDIDGVVARNIAVAMNNACDFMSGNSRIRCLDWQSASTAPVNVITHSGTLLEVENCNVSVADSTVASEVIYCGAGRVNVHGGNFSGTGLAIAVRCDTGLISLKDVIIAATGGIGLFVNGASSFIRHSDVDVSTCATQTLTSTGGTFNRGTFTLAGATAVSFSNLKATDNVKLTLVSLGGAGTGLAPRTVKTPGTGFTSTPPAGDTSVWDYEIS